MTTHIDLVFTSEAASPVIQPDAVGSAAPTFTPGPWVSDGDKIWAPNAKIGGSTVVFDVRGWGYLTGKGHGALGLPYETAVAIQAANGRLAALAPEMLDALTEIAGAHVPDNPAASPYDDLAWTQRHVARLRRIASALVAKATLTPQVGTEQAGITAAEAQP